MFLEPEKGGNVFLDCFSSLNCRETSKQLFFSFNKSKTVLPILGHKIKFFKNVYRILLFGDCSLN